MTALGIWLAVVNVTTPAELVTAINNAMPGDEIVLADGTYALTANVNCDTAGTEAEPIIVRAANRLGAHITFDATEGFKVSEPHWQFDGLDITGVCASDPTCEHAFHVTGRADNFVLRNSRVRDFNAQIKVNASEINGTYVMPHRGLIEYNEIGDTRGRNTDQPVTKINIDTGDDWVVRGNYLHDAYKMLGNTISYVAFMKSGGNRGLFERNLVICSREHTGGTRIGLSFGGGGTGNQFCAPAFDVDVECATEHYDGTMRNNIIASCSDVGIYVNEGASSRILYNTIIATDGIDFNYPTATGDVVGNLVTGVIRDRNGSAMTASGNMAGVAQSTFEQWYAAPLTGDLTVTGDISALIGAGPTRADVTNDYCAASRPAGGTYTLGALEHSVTPSCDTTRPPVGGDSGPAGDHTVVGGDDAGTGGGGNNPGGDEFGCCQTQDRPDLSVILVLLGLGFRRRTTWGQCTTYDVRLGQCG